MNLKADGSVKLGPNVARVTPEASSAGYVGPTLGTINLIKGATTSTVDYEIVDPHAIKDGHKYYITFEDTIKAGAPGRPDTLTTKNYSLIDSTANKILINKINNLSSTFEQPIVDGFKLSFNNAARVEVDKSKSKWNSTTLPPFIFEKFVSPVGPGGQEKPNDYKIFFGNVGFDTSQTIIFAGVTFSAKPVNFKVFNVSTNSFLKFGFLDIDNTGGDGKLSAKGGVKDRIIFLEPNNKDSIVTTWWFYLSAQPDTSLGQTIPQPGDTAYIFLKKPFLSSDTFEFTAKAPSVDNDLAKASLDNIKVVPNPYLGSAQWEVKNPYSSGRGPRSLHFIHLPAKCTIRIFAVDGQLVNTLQHDSAIDDGTEDWDMLTKDNLAIAYGVYIYHIEAPGVGEKIGKFAVIK